jgi:hypothetical protein
MPVFWGHKSPRELRQAGGDLAASLFSQWYRNEQSLDDRIRTAHSASPCSINTSPLRAVITRCIW